MSSETANENPSNLEEQQSQHVTTEVTDNVTSVEKPIDKNTVEVHQDLELNNKVKGEITVEEKHEVKEEETVTTTTTLPVNNDAIITSINYDTQYPLHSTMDQLPLFFELLTGIKLEDKAGSEEEIEKRVSSKDALPLSEKMQQDTLLNLKDKDGNTALHQSVLQKSDIFLKLLLKVGRCDINNQNNQGETPIYIATMKRDIRKVIMLGEKGGNCGIPNNAGVYCLEFTRDEIDPDNANSDYTSTIVEFGGDLCLMYQKPLKKFHEKWLADSAKATYDTFGFVVKKGANAMDQTFRDWKKYETFRASLTRKESYRVKKFKKMILQCKPDNPHPKLKERVRKGVPNAVRGELWKVLLPIAQLKESRKGVYQKMLDTKALESDLKQIDKDVNRCFRDHRLFQERYGEYQIRLFNVLRAYTVFYPDLGYCQGMSSVAALLLMYLDEEESFWAFAHIMASEKHCLGEVYPPKDPKRQPDFLSECFYVIEHLMLTHLPKLAKHFQKVGFFTALFATKWFLMLFLDCLPFEISIMLWDIFFCEGHKIIFNATLGLLKLFESDLLKMNDIGQIKLFLQGLENKPIDIQKLIEFISHDKVKRKMIMKLRGEYRTIDLEKRVKLREQQLQEKTSNKT